MPVAARRRDASAIATDFCSSPWRLPLPRAAISRLPCPAAGFQRASTKTWAPPSSSFARGVGGIEDGALVVTASERPAPCSSRSKPIFASSDYRAIAWNATNVPDNADVRLLWRSDYAPAQAQFRCRSPSRRAACSRSSLAKRPELGRTHPRPRAPDPGSARDAVAHRAASPRSRWARSKSPAIASREWIAFEGFSGTSIDSVTGGADVQDLPLPVLLALRSRSRRGCCGSRSPAIAAERRSLPVGAGGAVRRPRGSSTTRAGRGTSPADARDRAHATRASIGASGISPPRTARCFAFIEERAREAPADARARVHGRRRALFPRPRRLPPLSAQRLFRALSKRDAGELAPAARRLLRRLSAPRRAVRSRPRSACAGTAASRFPRSWC